MTSPILSCPFCAHDDVQFDEAGSDIFIACPNCETLGPRAPDVKQAILAWNRCGDKPIDRFAEAVIKLPLGLTVDDVHFILERYDVAFELSTCGGFYQDDAAGDRERTYLTIIRKMIEKGVM